MVPLRPCWVTVNARGDPAAGVTVMMPVRGVVDGLAAAAQVMVALAVPEAGEVRVSHGWLLAAVHVSVELLVVKTNEPVPPEPGGEADVGSMPMVVASCVTVTVAEELLDPVTVMMAVRSEAPVFPVTVY